MNGYLLMPTIPLKTLKMKSKISSKTKIESITLILADYLFAFDEQNNTL
jgi:hypothetical protein